MLLLATTMIVPAGYFLPVFVYGENLSHWLLCRRTRVSGVLSERQILIREGTRMQDVCPLRHPIG